MEEFRSEQWHKCFKNKHYDNLKVYISPFGNVDRSGHIADYALPGVDPLHWEEISYQEFVDVATPEAIVIIDFIVTHKRLPNFIAAHFAWKRLYK